MRLNLTNAPGRIRASSPTSLMRILWTPLAFAVLFLSPGMLKAQGVSFSSESNPSTPCPGDGVQALGTTVVRALSAGTIVANSSIILNYSGNELLGTATVLGTGAGSITVQQVGNSVILLFNASVAYVSGDSISVSGLQMNLVGLPPGGNLFVTFSATSPSINNQIGRAHV